MWVGILTIMPVILGIEEAMVDTSVALVRMDIVVV